MKWSFSSEDNLSTRQKSGRKIKHALVNVGVVTSWLFAVSDFPLRCWMESTSNNDSIIRATRGILVVLIQVITSFEVFDIGNGDVSKND